MYRFTLGILLIAFCFLTATISAPNAYALKKRIRAPKPTVSYTSVRLARNTNSVYLSFANLTRVARIDYALSYKANGIEQGVMGAFVPSGQATDGRDLYFGTCSHGVCTPHYGITNASLTVTTTLKGGATYIKRYVFKRV